MLNIRIPPNIMPTGFNLKTQSFISEPIPGLVRVPLGIPMVHLLDGDPNKAVTAVCAHSLESLQQYLEGREVLPLADHLIKLVWGTENTPGLFHLPGMGLNRRSKGVDPHTLPPGDGSYNLASTVGEGEGIGNVFPALQTNTPGSAAVIQELLQVCHQLYRLVMPLCVSKIEWDLAEFIGRFNNVIAFGGFEPGPTSCQGNSSSSANVVKGRSPPPPYMSTQDWERQSCEAFTDKNHLLVLAMEMEIEKHIKIADRSELTSRLWCLFGVMAVVALIIARLN
jgi:hypothetical protein